MVKLIYDNDFKKNHRDAFFVGNPIPGKGKDTCLQRSKSDPYDKGPLANLYHDKFQFSGYANNTLYAQTEC